MTPLDVVTPVTRPKMTRTLGVGVKVAEKHFDVQWWMLHDCLAREKMCARFNIGTPRGRRWYRKYHLALPGSDAGWAQRNWHLDNGRPDAFVWWCDDDTTVPAAFFPTLAEDLGDGTEVDAVVYAMAYPPPPEGEPRVLHPNPDKVEVGSISGSMVVFRRRVVGDLRAELVRTSDGVFLKALLAKVPKNRVLWVDDPLVLYNAQDPERNQ